MVAAAGTTDAIASRRHWPGGRLDRAGRSSSLRPDVSARAADQPRPDAEAAGGARGSRAGERWPKLGYPDTPGESTASGLACLDRLRCATSTPHVDRAGSLEAAANAAAGVAASSGTARARGRSCRSGSRATVSGDESAAERRRHDARRRRRVRTAGRVPSPFPSRSTAGTPHGRPNWNALFDAAGLRDERVHARSTPTWIPLVYADERAAWEGRCRERPGRDLPGRSGGLSAASRVLRDRRARGRARARSAPTRPSRFNASRRIGISALVMPALMLAARVLARHNIKLGRGDRAAPSARRRSCSSRACWPGCSARRTSPTSIARSTGFFARSAPACSTPPCCGSPTWALEPYVRRFSPDSLIGWTRLIARPLARSARRTRRADRRRRRACDDAALRRSQPAAAALRPAGADAGPAGPAAVLMGAGYVLADHRHRCSAARSQLRCSDRWARRAADAVQARAGWRRCAGDRLLHVRSSIERHVHPRLRRRWTSRSAAAIIAIFVFVIVRCRPARDDRRARHALHPAAGAADDSISRRWWATDRSLSCLGTARRARIRRVHIGIARQRCAVPTLGATRFAARTVKSRALTTVRSRTRRRARR